MKIVKSVLLVLGLYAFLHNPLLTVLGGMGLCKVLYLVAIVYFAFDYKSFLQTCKIFKKELSIYLYIFIFVLIRTLVGGDSVILYTKVILLIESFIIPIAFATYWSKHNYSSDTLISFVLLVSSIASIISAVCIVNPTFGAYVRYQLQVSSEYILEHEFRGFGVSDSLTSSFGFIQGACFALAYKYYKTNKWVIIFMPFIFFSALINARTGVIIAIVGIIIELFSQKHYFKSSLRLAVFTILFLMIVPYFLNWVNPSERTIDFILDFWEQMQNIEDNSTVDALNNSLIMPANAMEWIIGKGIDLFGQPSGKRSDVGYIIQLNYGGFIYVSLLYGLILYMIRRLWSLHYDSFFPLFFLSSLALLNYKANILNNTGYFRFVMLLYFVVIITCKNRKLNYNRNNI